MSSVTLYPASTTAPGNPSVFYRNNNTATTSTTVAAAKCRSRFRTKPLSAALVEETRPRSLPPIRGDNSTNGAVSGTNVGASSIVPSSRNRADDIQAESKALARAGNATVYSPELLKFKYASRPFKVIRRTLQVLVGLGSFGLKLWIDQLQGQLELNRRSRAVELRETFTRLGPTFVKIGQGLSTRPDLCPPEFLEELSELQIMSPLESLLLFTTRALCTPFAVFVQIQGCVICLLLAAGWAGAAYVRNREIRQMKRCMKDGNDFAFLSHDIHDLEHSKQVQLPGVTVVMPLKGFGEHNLHNWRTQLTSLYGGPLEFLFIVDTTEDPAYHAVSRLLLDFKDDVDARIVVAGPSSTCSQKIHNQLVGVEKMQKGSKYVLFLDDDVRLHPGSIGALTAEMMKKPEIFIQTGYPLDLPSGSLGSYCIYEYHMPCSMGFATGGRTFFLWGGCMMMHADDFRTDKHGVVTQLRDGGYSDDMTLAAIAVFPHPLASDLTFSRYWNYLRKQTFVLESYTTYINWIMNRCLFSVHCYLSWGFVSPYIMAMFHIAAALRFHFKDNSLDELVLNPNGLRLVGCLVICTAIELLSMWNLTRIEVRLCNMLSPEAPPLSLGAYNWCLVFVAMVVDNFLYPISAIRSHFSQSINWSGIRYHLRNGKIHKIDRIMEKGKKFSDLAAKRLYGRKAQSKISILSSLSRSLVNRRQPKKYEV